MHSQFKSLDIFCNGVLLTTVFFDGDIDLDLMRRSMIDDDGYPDDIVLKVR